MYSRRRHDSTRTLYACGTFQIPHIYSTLNLTHQTRSKDTRIKSRNDTHTHPRRREDRLVTPSHTDTRWSLRGITLWDNRRHMAQKATLEHRCTTHSALCSTGYRRTQAIVTIDTRDWFTLRQLRSPLAAHTARMDSCGIHRQSTATTITPRRRRDVWHIRVSLMPLNACPPRPALLPAPPPAAS